MPTWTGFVACTHEQNKLCKKKKKNLKNTIQYGIQSKTTLNTGSIAGRINFFFCELFATESMKPSTFKRSGENCGESVYLSPK